MAIFNPGSSTLKSVSYEGALHEAIQLLRIHLDPAAQTTVGIEISEDSSAVDCSVEIPLSITIATSGQVHIEAIDETINFSWNPDPLSDASASSLAAMVLAIAAKINAGDEITGGVDRCQLSISTDTKKAVIVTAFLLEDRPQIPALSFGILPYVQDF
jgi:hypothetical protein